MTPHNNTVRLRSVLAAAAALCLLPGGPAVAAPVPEGTASATRVAAASAVTAQTASSLGRTATPSAAPAAATRERRVRAKVTSFTPRDNNPPGRGISFPVKHARAGGVGTYDNPITLASGWKFRQGKRRMDHQPGARVYLPHIKRYGIIEDSCHECGRTPRGARTWVDVWVDGPRACANTVEGFYVIILNPRRGYPVKAGDGVYDDGKCRGGGRSRL